MEENRARRPLIRAEDGAALVVVLMAIAVLLPPTLVLATLALRWQRQSIDFRDRMSQELGAQAVLEEARARIYSDDFDLPEGEGRTFEPRPIEGLTAAVRVSRADDVVLTLDGRVLRGIAAGRVDLEAMGVDPEGRMVYQFRKVEIYLVDVHVSRRPSLPAVRLYGVLGVLPDGSVQTLGVTLSR
jgi:hypothetical protein